MGGAAAYGVLCGEDGIHEFNYGKTSKLPKVGRFVRVRVLPIVDTPGVDLGPQHLESRRATAKGPGKHVARYKSRVTLTHRPSLVSVQATNGLAPEKSAELCRDWLQAELARRKLGATANGATPGMETVVRKYTLRPTSSARDERTGVSISSLRELWNGALDVFLHAQLAARSQRPSSAASVEPASCRCMPNPAMDRLVATAAARVCSSGPSVCAAGGIAWLRAMVCEIGLFLRKPCSGGT